mgnify:CR=1 FL=1
MFLPAFTLLFAFYSLFNFILNSTSLLVGLTSTLFSCHPVPYIPISVLYISIRKLQYLLYLSIFVYGL